MKSTSKPLKQTLDEITSRIVVLPDQAQCQVCGYWDMANTETSHILLERDPTGVQLLQAACRCPANERRKVEEKAQRFAEANLPTGGRTFENFNRVRGTEAALEKARHFAQMMGPSTFVLCGETGTGKSHLLEAIGRYVLAQTSLTVRYEVAADLLERLRHTYADVSSREFDMYELTGWYQRRHVLLLDDVGVRGGSDWAVEVLTSLIDERIRNRWRLAVATNLTRDEMEEKLGARLASRLFQQNEELGQVARMTITASDYRLKERKP